MPSLKTYDLFISHAWRYGDDYTRLTNMLDNATNFYYRNYSAPKDKPLHNIDTTDARTKDQIKPAIIRKISPVNAVLVISVMYYNYREWMQYEMDIAKVFNKPIIALKPYGASYIPKEVEDKADIVVNWNTESIIKAIRQYSL